MRIVFLSKIGVIRLRELNTYTIYYMIPKQQFYQSAIVENFLGHFTANLNINNFAIHC